MKIICWLLFILLNYWSLFVFAKKINRPILIKGFVAMIPILSVCAILFMFSMKLIKYQPNEEFKKIFFAIFFSLIIICVINTFNQVFFLMLDNVISFHKKNNANNLDRQPIKFFITKKDYMKKVSTIIWFLGSVLMLYGVWLG